MTQEEHKPDSVDLEFYAIDQLMAADALSGFGCPDCGGPLWQLDSGQVKRYQCHIGHAFVLESLLKNQTEAIERRLWTALRLLREQIATARQLTTEAQGQQRSIEDIEQIEAQIQQSLHQAELLQQALLSQQVSGALETRPVSQRNYPPESLQ